MSRVSTYVLACLISVANVAAEDPTSEVTRLKLRPARTLAPALRVELLPELRDQHGGNAALHYYRAILLKNRDWSRETDERIQKWLDLPVDQLPREEVGRLLAKHKPVFTELEAGSRCRGCDWQEIGTLRREGFEALLPSVTPIRECSRLLLLQSHLNRSTGNIQRTLETLKVGFALGRDVGETPTIINALVGVAIMTMMTAELEELIQQPQAPNLYWALTDLPVPLCSLRKSFQGELLWIDSVFGGAREAIYELKSGPLAASRLRIFEDKLARLFSSEGNSADWRWKLTFAATAAKVYPQAKQALLADGLSAAQIEAMPIVQVALIEAINEYETVFDDMRKWVSLPYWQAQRGLHASQQALDESRRKSSALAGLPIASMLLPATQKICLASARLDRRIAALRGIEALRNFTALHGGQPPDSWSEITDLPIPIDPITGKPFEYRREGNKVTLFCPYPEGESGRGNSVRYEIEFAN